MDESPTVRFRTVQDAVRRATLYGILDLGYVSETDAPEMARKLVAGGVHILQLRAKHLPADRIVALGRRVAPVCREAGVPFFLNDYPDLVGSVGADGVHVGQDDMPVAQARELAGAGALVGKSTHCLDQAVAAEQDGADYIGFGPLFPTPTKPDYTAIGLDAIGAAHRLVGIPIFCIGGIKFTNLPEVLRAGARRAVIVSGLLQADDVVGMIAECLNLLGQMPRDLS